jgi:hypothetical protein
MPEDDDQNLTRTIDRLKRHIEELEELADDANSSQRHAWFPYMAGVLEVYLEMKAREVVKKESKLMCKISGVKNGERLKHSIRRIIAATSKADGKAASKMTLALRYALHEGWNDIVAKLKKHGGIAACARKFSKLKKPRKPKK